MKNQEVWGASAKEASTAMEKLAEAVEPVFSFEDALQLIIDDRNTTVDELNEALDENYSMKDTLIKAEDLADKHIALQTDYNDLLKKNAGIGDSYKATVTNYELLKGQKATVDAQLKTLQDDHKKLKKNSTGHKASNDTLRKQNARLTKQLKEKPNFNAVDTMPLLSTVYDVKSEILVIYPQQHVMNNGTKVVKQTVLLYSDMRGVFLTACLDEDNQAVFSSPLDSNDLSERTIATYRKHSISPSEAVQAYATQWLYRINVQQNGKVERFDLAKFTGE